MIEIKPIKRNTLASQVCEQILLMIKKGELIQGDRLPSEEKLCEMFNVSRTVIREATTSLTSKGILEKRNKGIFVSSFDVMNIVEGMDYLISSRNISIDSILEARQLIEGEIASLASLRASDEEIEQMKILVKNINDENDRQTIKESAAKFHKLLAIATHNPLIVELFMVLDGTFYKDTRSKEIVFESASSHKDILDKIESRDAIGAKEAMYKHLQKVRKTY